MAFTGKDPKDTYLAVLNLGGANEVLHATTPQAVLDAAGNASLLELSQSVVEFTGIMTADVASGIVMETGIDFTSDAVITDILKDKTDNAVGIHFTAGDPESSLTASVGSLALRRDGSAGATLYVKETGTGNTGWSTYDLIASFLDLTDTPGTFTADKWLKVNAGGTLLEWADAPIGAFTALSDTPVSYAGEGGKTLRVNSAPDGIEFIDSDFLSLDDTPSSYTGNGIIVVNAAGTALAEALSSAVQGDVIFRGAVGWETLDVGTDGQLLKCQGAAADPIWVTFTASGLPAGDHGDALYYNGSDWVALGYGTAGQLLNTNGLGSAPSWESTLPLSPAQGEVLFWNGSIWAALGVGTDGYVLTTHSTGADPTWDSAFPASPNQGEVIYYNGSAWVVLGVGTDGQFLKTQGAAANPTWDDVDAFPASPNQGEIVYYTGAAWANLGVGTDGQFLKTQGAAADPVWSDIAGDVLDLADTPSDYGSDGDIVYTNGSDAWEYQGIGFFLAEKVDEAYPDDGEVLKAESGGSVGVGWYTLNLTELGDTPSDYSGQTRGILGCNTGEDSVEFYATDPGDGTLFRFDDGSGNWEAWDGGGTDGNMIYMSWGKWEALGPGNEDQILYMESSDTPGWTDIGDLLPSGEQGSIQFHNGSEWDELQPGDSGQVLTSDGTGEDPSWEDPVEDFTDLGDTPANYTSAGDKVVKVNSTPDGLEYGPRFLSGSGSPENNVTADPGDFYTRTGDGSTTDILYVKATGTDTDTGWAKVTSATAT